MQNEKNNTSFPDDRINYVPNHGWVTYSLVNECKRFLKSPDLDYYAFFQRLEEVWHFLPVIISGNPYKSAINTIELITSNIVGSNLNATLSELGKRFDERIDLYNDLCNLIKTRREYETKKG